MLMLILELSLSGFLTVPDQGALSTLGELLNISTLDPLFPTFLIATLCLCVLLVLTYHSLALAWEVFWASRQSPSLLDPSTEVVLTDMWHCNHAEELEVSKEEVVSKLDISWLRILCAYLCSIEDRLLFGIVSSVGEHQTRIAVPGWVKHGKLAVDARGFRRWGGRHCWCVKSVEFTEETPLCTIAYIPSCGC